MSDSHQPVISLLDMDCFYVQVETRDHPDIGGKPAAVVQYNTWQGGGIIAVSYEARAAGVTRNMRGEQAREKCPEIALITVPVNRGKADLGKYRKAGREVIEVLLDSGAVVERASIDEAYIDLTKIVEKRLANGEQIGPEHLPNTWLGGDRGDREEVVTSWCRDATEVGGDDLRLAVGARIMEEIRSEVLRRTGFRCSAGVAHCKTLAKLCCGLNKPNKQTMLPDSKIPSLYADLKVTKVRGLGGKLGAAVVQLLGVETMGQLSQLSLTDLQAKFEAKTAHWLYNMAKGKDGEVVKERELPKSIGCGKNFRGKEKLDTRKKLEEKLNNLVEELIERLEEDRDSYNRLATGLSVGVAMEQEGYVSRAAPLRLYTVTSVFSSVMSVLTRLNTSRDSSSWSPALLNVSLSAGKFVGDAGKSNQSITSFFSAAAANSSISEMSTQSYLSKKDSSSGLTHLKPKKPSIKTFFENKLVAVTDVDKEVKIHCEDSEDSKDISIEINPTGKSFFAWKMESLKEGDSDVEEKQLETEEEVSDLETLTENTATKNVAFSKDNEEAPNNETHNCPAKSFSDVDLEELIPSLDSFDQSLLELLPKDLQIRARERLEMLRDQPKKTESSNSITSFLSSSSSSHDLLTSGEMVNCDQCGKKVSPFTLPEHLDWHLAISLSKQSQPSSTNIVIKNNKIQTQTSGKRKRVSVLGDADNSKKSCQREISNFFSRK